MAIPDEVRLSETLLKLAVALLGDASLTHNLERLAQIACKLIQRCSGASISMLVDGRPTTVAVSDHVALHMDLIQYDHNDGPCITALGGETVRVGFLPSEERFPHFATGAADSRVRSVLSTPAADEGIVVGALNVYSFEEDAFDERDRQAAEVIAAQIASALVASTLLTTASEAREELQEQHDTAVVVAQAKGVLIGLHDCTAAQAAELIRHAANDNGESMIETAERILSSLEASGPAGDDGRNSTSE